MDRKGHWENAYTISEPIKLSWFQSDPALSMELIRSIAPRPCRIIDVGGGASLLVDRLLDDGFEEVSVLDISRASLERAEGRLGERAGSVRWVEADLTTVASVGEFDLWHDRAVFHFLTDSTDRRRYLDLAARSIPEHGYIMIATFADEGPRKCSGLEVCRYNARTLADELGDRFSLVREASEIHVTPGGSGQAFFYGLFRRRGASLFSP